MRAILVSCLLLAGCAASGVEPSPDPCGASGYQSLVGRPLAAVTLPADLDARIIGPDTAVTMDHRPDRLNIEVDGDGVITRVRCG